MCADHHDQPAVPSRPSNPRSFFPLPRCATTGDYLMTCECAACAFDGHRADQCVWCSEPMGFGVGRRYLSPSGEVCSVECHDAERARATA